MPPPRFWVGWTYAFDEQTEANLIDIHRRALAYDRWLVVKLRDDPLARHLNYHFVPLTRLDGSCQPVHCAHRRSTRLAQLEGPQRYRILEEVEPGEHTAYVIEAQTDCNIAIGPERESEDIAYYQGFVKRNLRPRGQSSGG